MTTRKEMLKEFQEFYMISSLPSMRIAMILTLLLFSSFSVFNHIFFPDSPEQLYYNRFWVVSPVMVISIVVTYIRPFYRHLHPIFVGINLLMCIAVFYVGIHSEASQAGSEYYYAWVMLVVIGLFVFYKMPFISIVIIGLIQIIAFSSANYINGNFTERPFYFYNNLFFVISIYSIGFMMAYMFRQLNWRNFTHQQALSENNRKLMEEVRERKFAVDAYQQSELQYHNTLDSIPDWIYVIDREKRIVILNSSLREVHSQNGFPSDVIGKKITDVYPFLSATTIHELEHVFREGVIYVAEQKMEISGVWHYMETRKVPIFRDNKVYQVMTILRDRSKEKEVEELKQRNAEQKEIMLREIHHRVKNNLAIVISLLSLQIRNNDDPVLLRIIRDIEMRIRSMALIHEHLYRSENIDRIPLASYLHALATIITGTFSGHRIKLITDLEPVDVSIETALPIGLIANELLTNAFKYAFPNHGEGEITISLEHHSPDDHTLAIRDNGIGLPDHFSLDSEKSLGMFIVRLLVEQLDGHIGIDNEHGTEFRVRFKNIVVRKQELNEKPVQ